MFYQIAVTVLHMDRSAGSVFIRRLILPAAESAMPDVSDDVSYEKGDCSA